MPTVYPAAIDAFVNPTGVDTLDDPPHDGQHANANDAAEAIETELGINPRGSAASVRARLDALPLGVLGYAQVVAQQTGITTEVDLTGLSVAVTALAGRRIRISAEVIVLSSVSGDTLGLSIMEGATRFRKNRHEGSSVAFWSMATSVIIAPSVGAHTYKLTMVREVGTGSITVHASATDPAFILVEDLGPAA